MCNIYNKKLISDRSDVELTLLCSSTLVLIIQMTDNFEFALRFTPITFLPVTFKYFERQFGRQSSW